MDPILARYATQAAPRYTSYPTAPHFRADFPAQTWAGWLNALDPATPVSLYVHIPFCKQMCWYCGCNMKLAARYAPLAQYVEDLLLEIDQTAALTPGLTVDHLHFGGGTPTALEPDDLARIMERLRARFAVAPDAEIAIEGDPRTMTDAMIDRIGALGFNRASFGVQEFDPAVQKAINRIQPPEMVADCVGKLRAAGITGINFDLIYGLPHQTEAALARTVDLCAAMTPDRLALFGYAHVPWMAKNQRMIPDDALPGAAARMAQATVAATALSDAGYAVIGIDHFALPDDPLAIAAAQGRLRRNFQGYTVDACDTLIPFGATAIGRAPQGYVQNIAETGAWARAVRAGGPPVAKGLALSPDDRARAWVIERLMCDFAVDADEATRRFGRDDGWLSDSFAALSAMAEDGLVDLRGGRVAITDRGRPLARVVAAAFDAWLAESRARHSVAV
jgi:oxygen-independent coproporphyrinogen-3 oxidase